MSASKKTYTKYLQLATISCLLTSIIVFYVGAIHYFNPGISPAEVFTWAPFKKFIFAILPNIN